MNRWKCYRIDFSHFFTAFRLRFLVPKTGTSDSGNEFYFLSLTWLNLPDHSPFRLYSTLLDYNRLTWRIWPDLAPQAEHCAKVVRIRSSDFTDNNPKVRHTKQLSMSPPHSQKGMLQCTIQRQMDEKRETYVYSINKGTCKSFRSCKCLFSLNAETLCFSCFALKINKKYHPRHLTSSLPRLFCLFTVAQMNQPASRPAVPKNKMQRHYTPMQ